ncbi:hypothetical protein NT05LI_2705 [Listeria ivanovii FSL F6-596]|nr:hypothetical protein NT05LI_2705 [Listeria ivanovii FSL F6-596]
MSCKNKFNRYYFYRLKFESHLKNMEQKFHKKSLFIHFELRKI